MSDCDEHTQRDIGADCDAGPSATTATTIATTTTTTTTRSPGTVLRALLTHAVTTTPSSYSGVSISFTNPPPPPPPLPLPGPPQQPPHRARIASEILPRLFISDIFTALNAPDLYAFRITHIISVVEYAVAFPALFQPPAELDPSLNPEPDPISLNLTTLHVPLVDLPSADVFSYFPTTRDFIVTALRDENARVLVHCYKGQSRSPTIVAAYLIATFKISTSDALKTIQAKRAMVLPNRGFRRQLEQWEEVVREEDEMVCSDK